MVIHRVPRVNLFIVAQTLRKLPHLALLPVPVETTGNAPVLRLATSTPHVTMPPPFQFLTRMNYNTLWTLTSVVATLLTLLKSAIFHVPLEVPLSARLEKLVMETRRVVGVTHFFVVPHGTMHPAIAGRHAHQGLTKTVQMILNASLTPRALIHSRFTAALIFMMHQQPVSSHARGKPLVFHFTARYPNSHKFCAFD